MNSNDDKRTSTAANTAIGLASTEVVDRFGSAGAEFIKGLTGVDQETGQVMDRSLRTVADYRVDPLNPGRSIDQQAGFSAEIVKVSRENAENIIQKSDVRIARTEDVAGFGKNHQVADHVELVNGVPDPASISQMKFVNDPEQLLTRIARGEGSGKDDLSRYLQNNAIDLPTEQVEGARAYCRDQVQSLREQAQAVESLGKHDLAEKLRRDADNFEVLEGKIRDGGLSRDEARDYRLDPEWETAGDIADTSHRAGLEGAQIGAVVGGAISLVLNAMAVYSGKKEFDEAAISVLTETGLAAGMGYASAAIGSAAKALMQQSANEVVRSLSQTALPALAVATCFAFAKSFAAYADGTLNESELVVQMGATVSSTLGSSMGAAALGQIVIPIPVLGALVGGMVGSAVSGMLYQSYLEAGRREEQSAHRLAEIRARCEVARQVSQSCRRHIEAVIFHKLNALSDGREQLLAVLAQLDVAGGGDEFARGINQFAGLLGYHLEFSCRVEFDCFILNNNNTLRL